MDRLKAQVKNRTQQKAKNGVKVGDTYMAPGGNLFTVASLNDVLATATNGERLRCWFLKHKCDKQEVSPRPAVLPPEKGLGEEFKAYDWAKRALARAKVEGYNECRADALELGCPPQVAPDYFAGIVTSAVEAAQKAMVKFPQPNYVLLKVAEEAGEVVQAGVHYAEGRETWAALEGEVVQTIAMLYRLITEGDHVNGVIPPKVAGGEIAE
ncbi:hypothetical protein J3D56_003913 [Erwinia persicina]|uniref:hypothetical protein n=1 Tax=Erwinia persicina TaxID=55211 RepID=UPI0020A08E15|nr:hypothetical protein [Erwinia persicina]MCP1440477.1 hypothetical protein [Erwinia persicina]